jgi:DNA-binding Lrp family transcriptional regulator
MNGRNGTTAYNERRYFVQIQEPFHRTTFRRRCGVASPVFVAVKVGHHHDFEANEFVAAIGRWPEVLSCQLICGDMDFLLEAVVEDQDSINVFCSKNS